jgi:hypothetical protein
MSDKSKCEYCGEPLPAPPYSTSDRRARNRHFQNCSVRIQQAADRHQRELEDEKWNAVNRLECSGFTMEQATALVDMYGPGNP